MKESAFQARLIKKLKAQYPGCFILKNDAGYIQGFPDLLILYNDKWACLEVKVSRTAPHQPNQDYYVEALDKMSYAAFINPENEKEVLNELAQSLES